MRHCRIDCFKCRHFHITWDKNFPYGCRALGFKTRAMPSADVSRASGTHCLSFTKKDIPANKAPR